MNEPSPEELWGNDLLLGGLVSRFMLSSLDRLFARKGLFESLNVSNFRNNENVASSQRKQPVGSQVPSFLALCRLAHGQAVRYRPSIMELTSQERDFLRQIQSELSRVLRESGTSRPEALETAGLKEAAYDSAWSRGSMKLVWIFRVLHAHGVEPREFFDQVFGEGPLRPDTQPPKISHLARSRNQQA